MNTRFPGLAVALALTIGGGAISGQAMAQTAASSPFSASAVGDWLYNAQGNKIGSVRRLTDGGRTVVVMIGFYFSADGIYEARVPSSALSMVGGKATLQPATFQALNAAPRSRG
jgi:hypothetical protein